MNSTKSLGVGVGNVVGVGVGEGAIVGVGVVSIVGVGLGSTVGVGVTSFVGVGATVSVGAGVEVGVGVEGCSDIVWFWGLGLSRMMKSFQLSSVSCPLPCRASVPVVMDSMVEEDRALRSRLWVSFGLAEALAS